MKTSHRVTALCLCVLLFVDWATAFHNPINDLHGGTPAPPGNSPGPPGPDPPGGPCNGPNCESEPVETFTGQYLHDITDFSIPGRMPLGVRRLYRSGSSYQGMFGKGWNMEFNERILVLATNGNLLLRRGNSERFEFANQGGNYVSPPGVYDSLARNSDGTYLLREKSGAIRTYDNNGCLTEIRERNGNQLLFTYDAGGKLPISAISPYSHIATPIVVARDFRLTRIELGHSNVLTGRFLEFRYDTFGRVTNVADFSGRSWRYEYDPVGYGTLVAVTTPPVEGAPQGLTSRYSYSTNGYRMETLTDRRGITFLTNRYDAQGRVLRQDWGGAIYSFGYPSATVRLVTNGNGFRIERTFDTNGNVLAYKTFTAGLRPGEPQFYQVRFAYDASNAQAKVIYPGNSVLARRYDSLGNLVENRVKAADEADSTNDLVTINTYEPRFSSPKTVTDARGNVTRYEYDYESPAQTNAPGNLIRVTFPALDGQVYSVHYAYNEKGDVVGITNANDSITRLRYDPVTGYLLERVDAADSSVAVTNRYAYDARGNMLLWIDPRGNTNRYVYDALDRREQITSPAPFNYVVRYAYTPTDRVAREERQTGDAAHPWQITAYAYDGIDRLESVTDDLGNTTRFGYDANGNKARVTDANTNTTTFVYDERNLLWRSIDAQSNMVTLSYTPNGQWARQTDPRSNSIVRAYDPFDRLIAITNADSSTELFAYDRAGSLTERRTAAGRWITNSYDALNRLRQRRYADGGMIQYDYDAAGRIIRVRDTNGVWSFNYDALGRMIETTNGAGQRVQYAYDPAGNQTRLTYPDNTFVLRDYDNLSRLTNINYNGSKPVAALSYDPLHRRTRVEFGNGTRATYIYDYGNRLGEVDHTPSGGGTSLARFAYTFDTAGNRLSQNATGTRFQGQTGFQYDRLYQLTRVQYPAGNPFPTTTYEYDRAGNRARVIAAAPVDYVANSRDEYTSVGGQPYSYSSDGNLSTDGVWNYTFDEESRLITAQGPGVIANYAYDPFSRRVVKQVNGGGRQFFYNETGDISMLLGEADAMGNVDVKYVSYGLSPFAVVISNTVYTLHCDHVERPVLATDEQGAVAWEAAYAAFGQPSLAAGNRITQPLRTPGLYADNESGLNYNLARYYDPKLGRYLSEDAALEADSPLFLRVQEKTAYAYLRNNPVNAVDPNGQSVFFIVCSAGLPVCSAALFCSLNAGACSGGLVCSANIGVCSAAAACSGNAAGGCSASIAACSASVAAACSGNAGGVCSGAAVCSGQLGSGVGACSGSILACSGQAGVLGASACSANLVGACSGQASVVGGSACSAQLAGVCSAQAGVGASACSAQWSAGACSVQVGAGGSGCSGQMAGACSGQFGPGASYCSAQSQGACSLQWGPGPGSCSGQNNTCSASSNCPKDSGIFDQPPEDGPMYAGHRHRAPLSVSGLLVDRAVSGEWSLRFVAQGSARFTAFGAATGATNWAPIASGSVIRRGVTEVGGIHDDYGQIKLRLETTGGEVLDLGPFAMTSEATDLMAAKPASRDSRLASWLRMLSMFGCVLLGWRRV